MTESAEGPRDQQMSKASVAAAVQASLALCATCGHERGGHPADGPCAKTWMAGEEGKTEVRCRCAEYWARREDREDGMEVVDRVVSFGGGEHVKLDRRLTSEFWDGLRQGRDIVVLARFTVSGKGFREKDYQLTETRKCRLAQLYFLDELATEAYQETHAVLDAYGNDVDPATGEILDRPE